MLLELAVHEVGVIADARLVFGPGMTAVTGETGAGKTMIIEALQLLLGGRAEPSIVRPGANEATVEGRFEFDGDEIVLARVVPATGRSRAYVNGRLATAATLVEWAERLVDVHGQHGQQSLLTTATQRSALDSFAAIDTSPLLEARAEIARLDAALGALGGDERARARELDLLRFQVEELEAAAVERGDEDDVLADEGAVLADAVAHLDAAAAAVDALTGENGAVDSLGAAIAAVGDRRPFADVERRLRDVAAELADAADLRAKAESIEPDPERLTAIRERRQLLHELRRKYGETLDDVIEFAAEASQRLDELSSYEQRAADLDAARVDALARLADEEAAIRAARVAAAPKLGALVGSTLADLAMATAAVDIAVNGPAGEQVTFLLSANPGSPLQPLHKVASGGELARAMLALRLVLAGALTGVGPPTLVFDEVDAGIGGATAGAVGRALAAVAADRQVLVVTHLAQVAAFASSQVTITKHQRAGATTATAEPVQAEQRLEELARMLSGTPDSATARQHAAELLETAAAPAHHPR